MGPYDLNWETQQYKCWISQIITFALLACLQAINLFWLFLILRIGYNVVIREAVKDVRSDDEGEDDETVEERQGKKMNGTAETGKPSVFLNGKAIEGQTFNYANGHAKGGPKGGNVYASAEKESHKAT